MCFTNSFSKVINSNFLNRCGVVSLKIYMTIITELEHERRILGSKCSSHFVVIWLLSCVQLFVTPWTAACQASLSFTISLSLLKCKSIESVMPSNHLILCLPLLLMPSFFPSIRDFSNELAFPSCGQSIGASALASVLPMNIQGWFPLGLTGLISWLCKGLSRVFSSTIQKHQFFSAQPSSQSNSHIHTWPQEKP